VAQAHELVDVELVVREQHEVLEVLGRGAGVVAKPVQRIVDTGRGEQRQRLRLAGARLVRAVGDAVVHRRQVRQVEQVGHQQAASAVQRSFQMVVLGQREVHRYRLVAGADLDRHMVVLQQQAELLEVVAAEQVGPRQRGLVGAGTGHEAVAQARVGAGDGVGVHAHEGIAGPHAGRCVGRAGIRRRVAGDEALQRAAQVGHARLVDAAHLRERRTRVVEAGRGDEGRKRRHGRPLGVVPILYRPPEAGPSTAACRGPACG
jgi:hypothetical protein